MGFFSRPKPDAREVARDLQTQALSLFETARDNLLTSNEIHLQAIARDEELIAEAEVRVAESTEAVARNEAVATKLSNLLGV